MKRFAIWGMALFLFPTLALGAGFAKSSLFLSKSSVTEGESVLIYAPIENSGTAAFSGSLVFSEEGSAIGSIAITLKAGEARVVSVSWTPEESGSHKVSAELKKGEAVVEKQTATFSVEKKPAPTATEEDETNAQVAAPVQSSEVVKDWLGNISPVVEGTLAPVINFIDPVRQASSNFIDGQLTATKPKLPGKILGIETEGTSPKALSAGTFWEAVLGVLWTIYYYILTILNFLFVNAAIFYPVLALLFLFALWKLYQRLSGRSYRY